MNRSSTSPFRGTAGSSSRPGGVQSAQILIRTLEQQNNALVEEINVLKAKGKKMSELEDKIDMILRHNTQLLNQNERLAKLINQKKSQVQIWKNKHDSLMANRSTASDLEVKRLLNQIQKLKQESCEIEHAKNLQINEIKNQQNLQIQNLKRNNLSNAEKYELEIRKLKQYCDKKDYEVSDLKMKIARIGKETDFEIGKLREEKERLRSDLQFQEAEHRKEVQSLKSKFDYNFHSEIENLKKQHLNQIETLDYENSKLKEVINSKNLELEQSLVKQSKMRNHFEDSIELLKKENNELKQKLVENQHIADLELNNLREKLDSIKESELALLKDAHANEVDILNREISKLHKFLDSRNQEIENISKQRNQMRQALEAENLKLKAALDSQVNENKILTQRFEEELRNCDAVLKRTEKQMKSLQQNLESKIDAYRKQKQTADALLQSRQRELDRQRKETRDTFSKIEVEIQSLKEQLNQSRDQIQRTNRRASSDSQDQKKIFELKVRQLESKINGLEDENRQNVSLISELRENISLLQKQIKLNDEKIEYLQNTQKQLRNQSRDNFAKWDAKQKQLNRLIRQQIESMQRSKKNQIQQLKSIHDNKIRSLKHQIKELQKQLDDKNRLINNLKSKYEELVNNFEKVFAQEAARKNLDIKTPGWLPQTLALKSLFDVFLKNKVLQYCS